MEISLKELLDAREQRVFTQNEILKRYPCTLVCFTMNIAGPIKISAEIIRAFNFGLSKLEKKLAGYCVKSRRIEYEKCGPVAFYSVIGDVNSIKDICISIEESCTLGRLFDMDVIDISGKKAQRNTERCCIVCGKQGRSCAAGRVHPVGVLQDVTKRIITEHFAQIDSDHIALIAQNSLIKEVLTTPKPGLVDLNNTGSHNDMNVESFIKSAHILYPYFKKCVKLGIETCFRSAELTFAQLRLAGMEAEKDMYRSTGGVNTHKGIIYSLGIICGAIGRLWTPEAPIAPINDIFNECAAIGRLPAVTDFEKLVPLTAGMRLFIQNGRRGIRGEVADGFPSIRSLALNVYRNGLKCISDDGRSIKYNSFSITKKENDAGVITLLHLIANIYDTSLYNRGGEWGITHAHEYASRLISNTNITKEQIEKMDLDFIENNLSPGGAADLLAITYFLYELYK